MTTILIVDDEPDIRALLRIVLEREDFVVFEAGNGADALAVCRNECPDLVITDLLMPKMSGTDFLKALFSEGTSSKIIAMSGGSLGGDPTSEISKAQELGIDSVIVKPFDPAKVIQVCNSVLNEP